MWFRMPWSYRVVPVAEDTMYGIGRCPIEKVCK
jgi:hypothetical protein